MLTNVSLANHAHLCHVLRCFVCEPCVVLDVGYDDADHASAWRPHQALLLLPQQVGQPRGAARLTPAGPLQRDRAGQSRAERIIRRHQVQCFADRLSQQLFPLAHGVARKLLHAASSQGLSRNHQVVPLTHKLVRQGCISIGENHQGIQSASSALLGHQIR